MAIHSTNYYNTFIRIAPDSKAKSAEVPPLKEPRSAARRAYDMLADSPYQYTSDDVLYEVSARPRGISREAFFSKGQACFRASPLTKRYGFGLHYDAAGRMAVSVKLTHVFPLASGSCENCPYPGMVREHLSAL